MFAVVDRDVARFYVETLGCPKNAVDSDKVVASLLADGLDARRRAPTTPTSSSSTRARSSRRPARSRSTSRSRSPTAASAGARLVVTGCMAERYGDELAAALPEADAVVGFAGEGDRRRRTSVLPRPQARPGVRDLLELPRARAERAVGLREGRRGLRPRLRVLRDPVVPRQAALAHARVDRGRGARRSSTHGVAEIVLVAQDLAWYGRDAGEPGSLAPLLRRLDRARAARARARAAALPLPVRGPATRSSSTMLELPTGRAVLRPLAAARRAAAAARA